MYPIKGERALYAEYRKSGIDGATHAAADCVNTGTEKETANRVQMKFAQKRGNL